MQYGTLIVLPITMELWLCIDIRSSTIPKPAARNPINPRLLRIHIKFEVIVYSLPSRHRSISNGFIKIVLYLIGFYGSVLVRRHPSALNILKKRRDIPIILTFVNFQATITIEGAEALIKIVHRIKQSLKVKFATSIVRNWNVFFTHFLGGIR